MDDAQRLQFVGGQVLALSHLMTMLINAHPNPRDLKEHFEAVKQVGLAKVEGVLVPDEYLDGLRNIYDSVDRALEKYG
jgi:hypothetical protein